MAQDSSQERTEQPSERKLRKARERGEVWQSRDLTGAALLAAALLAVATQARPLADAALHSTRVCVQLAAGDPPPLETIFAAAASTLGTVLRPLAIVLAAGVIAAAAASFLQVGALLAADPLKPKLEKLNPIPGFKRQYFSLNTWVEFAKTMLKVAAVAWIAYAVSRGSILEVLRLCTVEPIHAVPLAWDLALRVAVPCVVFFTCFGVLDAAYQWWNHRRQNMMTKEEVKREYKETEGDPEHKAARKRLHDEILQGQMFEQVRVSNALIVNPTHYAVALRYDPEKEQAPRVMAKGQEWIARRMIEIAQEKGIPVYRDVPLARALHELRVDDQIPEALYIAVEEALLWVDSQIRERGGVPPWDPATRDQQRESESPPRGGWT